MKISKFNAWSNPLGRATGFALLLLIVGCGGNAVADARYSADTHMASNQQAERDPQLLRRGKVLFLQCRACHGTSQAEGHLVGPNLSSLFGSTVGKRDGFIYSESMAESDLVWDTDNLDAFLTDPDALFPGTKMAFGGIADNVSRRALIAYLQSATSE
ncbi:MAG: c-type cytochrome [Woeseiaceae bacterium]|nr:c-type cytochrome [Woeseiaceae bacterium]